MVRKGRLHSPRQVEISFGGLQERLHLCYRELPLPWTGVIVCVCVCVCFSHTHVYVYTYMNFVWMAFLHKSMQFVLPELPHFSLSPSAKFRIFLWNQQTTFSVEFSYEGDWINLCVKTYSLLLEYILKHLCFERTLKCGFWIHGRCPRCHRRKETQLPVTVEVGNFS